MIGAAGAVLIAWFMLSGTSHAAGRPEKPTGEGNLVVGARGEFSTAKALCDRGHVLEYRFDWGDGTFSNWSAAAQSRHYWKAPGEYIVRVHARCSLAPSVVSQWSEGLALTVAPPSPAETAKAPSTAGVADSAGEAASWKLDDAYLDPIRNKGATYRETPYPSTFFSDGVGKPVSEPPCPMFYMPLESLVMWGMAGSYAALEKDPRDKEALSTAIDVLVAAGHMCRVVPFAERYLAAGGELHLTQYRHYVLGLARLGRIKNALKHLDICRRKWDSRIDATASQLNKERFIHCWLVERDFPGMVDAFEDLMRYPNAKWHAYYVRRVLSETLRRAATRNELAPFLKEMDSAWLFLPHEQVAQAVEAARRSGATPSPAMLAAADPLNSGRPCPPRAVIERCILALDQQNDSDLALALAERAVELSRGADRRQQLESLALLARVLRQRGDLERASEVTRRYETSAFQFGFKDAIGWGKIYQGLLCECLADYRSAVEQYDAAGQMGAEHGYDTDIDDLHWSARKLRARALCYLGAAGEVESMLRDAAEESRRRKIMSEVPSDYLHWGICLYHLGRYDEAIDKFREGVNVAESIVGSDYPIDVEVRLNCRLWIARSEMAQKRFARAEQAFDKVSELSMKSQKPQAWWPWQLGKARACAGRGDREAALRWINKTMDTIEAQRASLSDFQHRRTLLDNKYEAYRTAVELLLEGGDTSGAFNVAERARAFLDELVGEEGTTGTVPAAGLAEVQKTCDGLTLVVYFQTPEKMLVWVVGRKTFEHLVLPVKQEELTAAVKRFRFLILSDVPAREAGSTAILDALLPMNETRDLSRELFDKLWKPIEEKVPKGARICIVPHQHLHYIPFQALFDGGKYLVEKHDLFYAPSASSLVWLTRKQQPKDTNLIVFETLLDRCTPFSKTETIALRRLYPDARVLMPEQATVPAFLKHAPGAGIVVFHGHGFFDPRFPLKSGLKFTSSDFEDPGLLLASRVYGMDLSRTGLVVMSACMSSLGDLAGGDEVTGMTRAFQVAGVPNVIGSLWPVENEATMDLMTLFYEGFAEDQTDPVKALCRAQRTYLKKEGVTISRWAAFQVTGRGRLQLRNK